MLSLLRRNRDLRALFLAQVISYGGDWFAFVALVGLVLELTGSAFSASLIFVSMTLPTFLASPVAGAAVDRFDRRRLMTGVLLAQSVAALGLLAVGPSTIWLAFVAQAVVGALTAFFSPASQASLPNLVEPEDLPTATALMSSTWGAMAAVGAALGGLFAAAFGRQAAFLADAASFAAAAALVATLRRPTSRRRSNGPVEVAMGEGSILAASTRLRPVRDTAEALRHARSNRTLLALLASKTGFGLGAGLISIVPAFATARYRAGEATIGILLGARGLGVLIGPFLARRATATTERILTGCGVAALAYGAMYLLMPLISSPWLAAVVVLAAHLGGGAQWTLSTYGIQVASPDAMRGRILAADFALVTLTLSISSVLGGAVASRFGPGVAIQGLAGVSLAWGSVYLISTRRLRRSLARA
ncbi:MAG: MFS transporter [Acidimicrobiia bacterium]